MKKKEKYCSKLWHIIDSFKVSKSSHFKKNKMEIRILFIFTFSCLLLVPQIQGKNECTDEKLIKCQDCRCCDANYCDLKEIPVPKNGEVQPDTKK